MHKFEKLPNGNILIKVRHSFGRVSNRRRIIVSSSPHSEEATAGVLENIAKSHKWWDAIKRGSHTNINKIAREFNVEQSYFYKQLRLIYLSPFVIDALLTGELPESITIAQLINVAQEPLWAKQHEMLGIA